MKKHILIVDDETAIREMLTEFFTSVGFRVTSAASAVEAQQSIAADPPQLVITDLQLEFSDGLEMIAQIKTQLPDVPVLLLTGVFFDPEVVRDTLSNKVAAYLQKTAPLARILEEVRRLTGP